MEIIKKQILLEPYRSRHCSLIPYLIEEMGEDVSGGYVDINILNINFSKFLPCGNWGKFPYDINLKKCDSFQPSLEVGWVLPSEDLKDFFFSDRISFNELSTMYYNTKQSINDITYYKAIYKNNKKKWVEIDINFREKLNTSVISVLPDIESEDIVINETILGVYGKKNERNLDIIKLFYFLLKAMGLFVVEDRYVKDDNGVPEIMYYTSVGTYLEKMRKSKNSEDCCKIKNYDFMGGDVFYRYLIDKQETIESEIKYWLRAIFKDELGRALSPNINMSIAINAECNTMGIYTEALTNETEKNEDGVVREISSVSPLKFLKRSKTTYATVIENGKEVSVELPMILDEYTTDNNGIVTSYQLTYPYAKGLTYGLTNGGSGFFYGDMIYRMDFIDDNETGDSGVVNIYYVIGGKFTFKNNQYNYVDNTSPTMPLFTDFVTNPQRFNNVDVDVFLYLKHELSQDRNYNDKILFKGDITNNYIALNGINPDETYVYRIQYNGEFNSKKCYIGDYIIVNNNTFYHFTMDIIKNKMFNGIRFFEQKKWVKYSFKNSKYQIKMLLDNYIVPWNILNTSYVTNSENIKLVDFSETDNVVNGVFYVYDVINDNKTNVIALEHDFGKIDMIVENSSDVIFDRGNVSSFELHYKLGEVTTMEDMMNYGNNFFGF